MCIRIDCCLGAFLLLCSTGIFRTDTVAFAESLSSDSNSLPSNASVEHWDFNYRDMTDWIKHYKVCGGKHQSPIDLTTGYQGDVTKISYFPPLLLSGYNTVPKWMNLTNNGHTVVVTVSQGMTATGGALQESFYHFTQLHFHWGSIDSVGSEHRRNGFQFPIEFHFVHYNDKYSSLADAIEHPDGILVIGVWGMLSNGTNNQALTPITAALKSIQNDHTMASVIEGPLHPLRDLLPKDADVYYHYEGSLTTPDCHESVTWIVFNDTIPISEAQLDEFRKLHQGGKSKAPLVDNFRPLQPINGRVVELVVSSSTMSAPSNLLLLLFLSLAMRRYVTITT